ncbi:hypothetical protein [Amycolatopsis anabasis]|uniref:hypothetical protein n=1 Tax=Amycolatopsis anabasis TaxID=1840409 RepID=UPI00131B8FEC|nr:hypothetical protein [Amycolatopsis anabasis]
MHDRREFARRCEELIDSLPIRVPFEVTAFLAELGEQRGTPLLLWRMNPDPTLPSGMLVRTVSGDYLFVVRGTSAGHLRHIVFHEVGHLVLRHPLDRVCGVPGERHFLDEEEAEAERFAYLLAARIRAAELQCRVSGPQGQLRSAFGSRRQFCKR